MKNNTNFNIAENDYLRSKFIRGLVQGSVPSSDFGENTYIPKNIIQFWDNLNEIPSDVQNCIESWDKLIKEGFSRVMFDDISARKFISERFGDIYIKAYDRCHHPAMRCDYFRLCYILINGGFYIDVDELYQGKDCNFLFKDNKLKIQPLCYDTATGTMVSTDTFIKKKEYSKDWIFYLNNNTIIAPAYHPVIKLALDRATNNLLNNERVNLEIQSTTGPGNLTASLVKHAINCDRKEEKYDFMFVLDWELISITPWPLSYRNDKRNWRLWNSSGLWKKTSL